MSNSVKSRISKRSKDSKKAKSHCDRGPFQMIDTRDDTDRREYEDRLSQKLHARLHQFGWVFNHYYPDYFPSANQPSHYRTDIHTKTLKEQISITVNGDGKFFIYYSPLKELCTSGGIRGTMLAYTGIKKQADLITAGVLDMAKFTSKITGLPLGALLEDPNLLSSCLIHNPTNLNNRQGTIKVVVGTTVPFATPSVANLMFNSETGKLLGGYDQFVMRFRLETTDYFKDFHLPNHIPFHYLSGEGYTAGSTIDFTLYRTYSFSIKDASILPLFSDNPMPSPRNAFSNSLKYFDFVDLHLDSKLNPYELLRSPFDNKHFVNFLQNESSNVDIAFEKKHACHLCGRLRKGRREVRRILGDFMNLDTTHHTAHDGEQTDQDIEG
jgi:hypothetical protein